MTILLTFVNNVFASTAFSEPCPDSGDHVEITEGEAPTTVDGTFMPDSTQTNPQDLHVALTLFKYYAESSDELTSAQLEALNWSTLTIADAARQVSQSEGAASGAGGVPTINAATLNIRTMLLENGVEYGPSISETLAKQHLGSSFQGYDLAERIALTKAMTNVAKAEVAEVIATGFKWGGRAVLIVGVTTSAVHVIYADDPAEAAVEEVSGWVTSMYFGSLSAEGGAIACAPLGGPIGSTVCGAAAGFIGGAVGYAVGSQLGKSVWYTVTHPSACNPWHLDKACGPAVDFFLYAISPPIEEIFHWVRTGHF